MRYGLLTLLMLNFFFSLAQIKFEKNSFDFGLVTKMGTDYIDFPITNTSESKVYIFRADADKRFQIHYTSKTILPDSTIFMRVLFSPDRKGAINESLPIHFSCFEKPVEIKVTGFVEEIPLSNNISCPSFSHASINTSLEHPFFLTVVDEETNEVLPYSDVKMIKNGTVIKEVNTKRTGVYEENLKLGYYYFVASHEGYNMNELSSYINRKNNRVVIPLQRIHESEELIVSEIEVMANIDEQLAQEDSIEIVEDLEIEVSEEDPFPDFSIKDYKPNNVVFLVDVSSSMNIAGKLDLLKASMLELSQMLRPYDKITVVSYATDAHVLLETTSGDDIDSVINKIQNLEAKGFTAGGKGMKLAYSKACYAFIHDGNNQIILATDGVFNTEEENVHKLAKKYSKKGVKISVVGIKIRSQHDPVMSSLAHEGEGNYINILDYEQAKSSLIEEIKKQSSRMP